MIDKKLKDFATLVKKMREAQMDYEIVGMMAKMKSEISEELKNELANASCNLVYYEDKVDRWLEELL